ncbi:hypothetical protein CspHIS471_0408100 [Cutaneotrichosporon sp. HIS471]|nr:hypothetical protein CspHIS471_0408100 [Cutaneotrichosporon sp. HIS471]
MASNPLGDAGPTPAPTPTRVARDTIVTVLSTMPPVQAPTEAAKPTKINIGPIVGGLVGGIVAGLAAIVFVLWYIRHRKENREAARRSYIRRRHKQMMAHAKVRSQYSASSSIYSGTLLKTPSPTETSFDPSVQFPAPSRTYMKAKEYDLYSNERGYGYEPQMILPPGGQYDVQAGYDPRLIAGTEIVVDRPDIDQHNQYMLQNAHRRSMSSQRHLSVAQPPRMSQTNPTTVTRTKSIKSIKRKSVPVLPPSPPPTSSSDSSSSPGSSPPMSPPTDAEEWLQRSQRGVLRAAAADQAAANATVPISKRHRPSRSSPLAARPAKMESPMNFAAPTIGPSPPISDDSGSSHAYAAAAQGAWGIPSNEGGMDFSRGSFYDEESEPAVQATVGGGLSASETHHLSPPPDAFAEYGQYIGGIEAGLSADDVVGREPNNPGWI